MAHGDWLRGCGTQQITIVTAVCVSRCVLALYVLHICCVASSGKHAVLMDIRCFRFCLNMLLLELFERFVETKNDDGDDSNTTLHIFAFSNDAMSVCVLCCVCL